MITSTITITSINKTLVFIFNSGFDFSVRSRQGSLAFLVIIYFSETIM